MTTDPVLTRRAFSFGAVATAAATAAAISAPAAAQSARDGAGAASGVLGTLRETLPIPAISAAVVQGGAPVWSEAQGMADLELEVAAQPGHLFRVGSVSKVVTAAVGARLAQAGTVDLDAPIATWRPDLPEQHRATTLRQLYGHQGGVRHYNPADYDFAAPGGIIDSRVYASTEEVLAIFINDPLVAEPGTASTYSTFGYTLISAVLESAAGVSFPELIAREVATPLGLSELTVDAPLEIVPGRASPYDPPEFYTSALGDGFPVPDGEVINAMAINPAYKWAGGGVVSSARDLARFGAAHLGGEYLTAEARADVFTTTVQAGPNMALGLGWRMDSVEGLGRRFHHAGSIQGGRAQLALYPDRGLSVAVMTNIGATPRDIPSAADEIAAAFAA